MFENINAILEEKDQLILPKIELAIFENSQWVYDNRLHWSANIQNEVFFIHHQFDIIIDHSILRRSNIYNESEYQNDNAIKIRSSHYFDTSFGNSRRVYCADLLSYKSLVKKQDDGAYKPIKEYEKNINFFIQNIFRKVAFREGQLPIISRALQSKPVIGLLPTGGGKSLAFQLPAFLQPGLSIGSCKKILRSLSETDLKKEWLLHLLRAFSMYSVNNQSYISDANEELELGFDNLYNDESYHHNDFDIIEPIFTAYFEKLQYNIKENNSSFNDIKLIRAKLLLKLQTIGIENIINKNKKFKEIYYA